MEVVTGKNMSFGLSVRFYTLHNLVQDHKLGDSSDVAAIYTCRYGG